ncbi:carboxylesterase/lipase family protein [Rhizosphaericola mali]|uniref:Carboxylic ester hydrolase n=1 Tax=Rhizosphaericola mali TaxID=2545455 RepID=A0A5P2G355_9BACT|nr:carboxylesterase family protein [Rhizosphaericola mali]QES88240.1 carboxylesterase family protein [Rhizosphaericola mali]
MENNYQDVLTQNGIVRGFNAEIDNVISFKGIPYAAAPVGPLRWRSPQEPNNWNGIKLADKFSPGSWGTSFPGLDNPNSNFDEDCLTINIWKPIKTASNIPVMVWIHGGGFQFGSSGEPLYNGAKFASKGVLFVSFNYRLGVWGFLAHEDLDKEGNYSGNFGLQDQLFALHWIKKNIANFGGDPNNITLFGESAGAHAVGLLMSSPLSKGLFHKAIGQSGAFWDSEHGSLSDASEARRKGAQLVNQYANGSLEVLRSMPASTLNDIAKWDFRFDPGTSAFSPNIDNYVITDYPANIFAKGYQMDIPLITGINGAEETLFLHRSWKHDTIENFQKVVTSKIGKENMQAFSSFYPSNTEQEFSRSIGLLIGDLVISEQTWEWAQLHRQTSNSQVYSYYFDYRSPLNPVPEHASEIKFVFGLMNEINNVNSLNERDLGLAEEMMDYWTNFAKYSDPNGVNLPQWRNYTTEDPHVLQFSDQTTTKEEPWTERFKFWQSLRSKGSFPKSWRVDD